MLFLNSLNRWVMQWMSVSYTPMETIMVPPDTPGMMLATPMTTPRRI